MNTILEKSKVQFQKEMKILIRIAKSYNGQLDYSVWNMFIDEILTYENRKIPIAIICDLTYDISQTPRPWCDECPPDLMKQCLLMHKFSEIYSEFSEVYKTTLIKL